MGSHNNMFHLEKLVGRENFATWKFSMKTYLEHEDLWCCVECPENKPVDASKDMKAKSKLILLLDPQNYVHVQECKTAKQVWENLQKAFDDNGLTRRVGLLKDLINTTLERSSGIEDYLSKIMNTAHKLRNIGFDVNDEWLGTLMLAGLPEEYKPMIMGLESSGIQISADSVKSKLIQEVSTSKSAAFYTNSKKTKNQQSVKSWGPRCYNCNQKGHFAKNCKQPKKPTHSKGESSSFVAAFSATVNGNQSDQWFIDSGASMHMTCRDDWMYNVTEPSVKSITVANREPLAVKGVGCVDIQISKENKIQVKNVLFVPGLAANLLSVSAIVKSSYKVSFNAKGCEIQNGKHEVVCIATLNNNLYILDTMREVAHLTSSSSNSNSAYLWHLRMGHLNNSDVEKLPYCSEGVTLTQDKSNVICTQCMEGKQARLPFNNVGSRATAPLELIHSDLCGPMENLSFGGMKYFITFIDDFTRLVHVYFLKDKLSVLEIFKDFKLKVENELNHKIKKIRTDNGTEYCNRNFEKFLSNHGIIHQTSTPYTPQHNGLAERMNRTLVERGRCMLFYANLEKKYWAEALATAAYVVNRSPTKSLEGKTPYEMWKGKKPSLSHMKIFGSEAMVHIPKEKRQKWDKKSVKMILVGYCETSKGYRLMDPKTHKIVKSRDVVFMENYNENASMPKPCEVLTLEENVSVPVPCDIHVQQEVTQEPSTSISVMSGEDSSEYETDTGELDESYHPSHPVRHEYNSNQMLRSTRARNKQNGLLCLFTDLTDPQTVEEALTSLQAAEWKKAMDEEYHSLMKNKTWTLTDLPPSKKALPYKWVFKTKTNQRGDVVRYKARLVIKGFAQRYGTDYEEVYSPVVRYTSIRYLFALAARYGMDIHQMDAVSAFLQGEIDREIYMLQPEEYKQGSQVCLLQKSIYGLKQASRLWNLKLNDVLHELGMQQSKTDPCVYFNTEKNAFIAIWVDDLIILTSEESTKNFLKTGLKEHLEMKDIGPASECVSLHITRDSGKVMLDQEKYIREILTRFGMADCKPVKTPFEVGMKFNENEDEKLTDCPYQQAIGCLLYIAQGTRPDISFAVNTLSRFNKNPMNTHWNAVKRIFRYLQGTKDYKVVLYLGGLRNSRLSHYPLLKPSIWRCLRRRKRRCGSSNCTLSLVNLRTIHLSYLVIIRVQVFYVWFDAPIGYLSITQNATKDFEQWWKPDKEHDVKLYQFMAKDNVPFHVIMFPATLLGVNEGHALVNNLFATEYLNYEEGKFSKSRGVGVFGTDAMDTGITSDVWRFYLASIRPETSDSSFSWTELGTRNNSELLNNLGNFCHRSLSFCASAFKGKVPDLTLTSADYALFALVNRDVVAYVQHMEKGRLREALRQVLSISKRGNQHMQAEQAWVLLKGSDDDKIRGATAIGVCCQLVALLCALLAPYMPDTCRWLREQLNIECGALRINPLKPSFVQYLPSGHVIGKPAPLFTKIEQSTLDELRAKYAGTQSERANKEKDSASVADLEAAITQQGEKVRQLKSSTKDKSVWQPEVEKLLALKKQLAAANTTVSTNTNTRGEKVRQLKSSTKDKSVLLPEVEKQLAAANTNTNVSSADLEKAITEQGEKVRQLKATTKDKSVWKPEVEKLLALKKQLANSTEVSANSSTESIKSLEKAIADQGDKVRKLKGSTKDKAVWQPEVNVLLDLKKRLAALQVAK